MTAAHTFVFADLAGFTALTEAHGDEHAADVAAELVLSARPLIAEHGGEMVKTLGDALLIRFGDAGAAVRAARDLVCSLSRRERSLGVRVGMHTGTAVQRGDDWFGSAVNVAARVAGVARAGEVVLSAATYAAAGDALDVRPLGHRDLKNVATAVELYALGLDEHLPAGRVFDPVCHMSLDAAAAAHRLKHEGREHAFCSAECQDMFRRAPGLYAPR